MAYKPDSGPTTKGTCRSSFDYVLRPVHWHSQCLFVAESRGSNRQSCDRDYNSRKEPADAEEHQNIVDIDGHGFPLDALGRRWSKGDLLAIVCRRRS